MLIDVAKSQMLTQLLQNVVIGLSKLSSQDLMLQQKINELKGFIHQHQVDDNILTTTINEAREIAASYPISDHKKDQYVINLPKMFKILLTEIEHQAKMKELSRPAQRLALEIERFSKLARII